ncbi:MAG: electron transport complex subunit E [Ruminococcus sp.]|nr:electron transport complex subunit E [Ruminococcus sp.]
MNIDKNGNAWAFLKGLVKENPTLVMLLGMCPTLAVTTMASNGIGMGLATLFVLVCSNVVISLLRKVIPSAVRLPCFIVIIAGFVTFIEFILKGYVPALYDRLGIFLSLITVNCIILGRAEAYASKNGVFRSLLDGLGMGIGFTFALFIMGSLREILGAGTWFGITLTKEPPMPIFIMPAGGFFTLGIVITIVYAITNKPAPVSVGCNSCPMAQSCDSYKCKQNTPETPAIEGGNAE